VLSQGEPVLDYPVDVGANGIGPKLQQGDRATPEGRYRIVLKKGPGQSLYHKALLLDYPNAEDRRRTAEAGRDGRLRRGADPGGLIEIHGDGGRGRNWTDGCVAVSNADMDVLYERLEVGAWVTIVGGDGRDGAFSSLVARLDARREVGR
jgi:murein L,D-transpeptidase YafK